MNRPTREEYEFDGCHDGKYKIQNGKTVGYVRHLENYCDSLEVRLRKMRCQIDNERVVAVGKCLERIDKLDKAIDKACSRIVEYEVLAGRYMEKDAVKEWAMTDESNS